MIKCNFNIGDRVIKCSTIWVSVDDVNDEYEQPEECCVVTEAHSESVLAKSFGCATYHLRNLEGGEYRYVSEKDLRLDTKYYRENKLDNLLNER